jgi:hypothetical protein
MKRIRAAAAAVAFAAGIAVSPGPAGAEFFGWQVAGVSSDDVLMVRAFPAAGSRILVGYPNATPLSLTGRCTGLDLNQINGWPAAQQAEAVRTRWCEVWVDPIATGDFQSGWVFGRYIRPL